MVRRIGMILWALLFVAGPTVWAGQAPPYRARVDGLHVAGKQPERVHVFATVTNQEGRVVPGLGALDFHVIEDDRPVTSSLEVRTFAASGRPLDYAFVFEHRSEMAASLTLVQEGAMRFFQDMGYGPRGLVVDYTGPVQVAAGPVADPNRLAEPILAAQSIKAPPRLADGLMAALDALEIQAPPPEPAGPARRAIILLSQGVDQGSRFSLNAAAARLRGSGAALFIVGYGLEETWPLELKDAAEASGGGWFSVTVPDDVIPLLTLVAERLRGQYILSYTNPEPRSGSGDRRLNLAVMGVRAEAAFRVADDSTSPTGLVAPLIFLLLAVLSLIGALLWSGKVGGRKKESARESEE